MILYNVTFDMKDKRNILEPSIPESAGEDENKTIKRVCLTDSIEHCMQAIAVGNRDVRVEASLIVRKVDTKYLDTSLLIKPKELKERGLVPDALENNEYWYLGTVNVKCGKYQIVNFDAEIDLAWTCININDCKKIIRKYLPLLNIERYRNTKNLYEYAMSYCSKYRLYDIEDIIWDELAMLPWAQKRNINKVQLIKI